MSAETIQPPKILDEWLNQQDTKDRLQRCADTSVLKLRKELALRVPRSSGLRCHRFAAWRENLRNKLGTSMQDTFAAEFIETAPLLRAETINEIVKKEVWPRVESELIDFAVECIAMVWVRRNLGDALYINHPRPKGSGWIVDLGSPTIHKTVGHVIVDRDGDVVESESTMRSDILAAMNG